MWFKSLSVFRLNALTYNPEGLAAILETFAYEPCSSYQAETMGWVNPYPVPNLPLVHAGDGKMLLCLQIEEKLLPAKVVNQSLVDKVHAIEGKQSRKVYRREKVSLKEEVYSNLLPQAFSQLHKIFCYFDTKLNLLFIDSVSQKRISQLLTYLRRSLDDFDAYQLQAKEISYLLAQWTINDNFPESLQLEHEAVLQDPKEQRRIIRCQQQDVQNPHIRELLVEGYEIQELALCWREQIKLKLTADLTIKRLQFLEILRDAANLDGNDVLQQMDADFILMAASLSELWQELAELFVKPDDKTALPLIPAYEVA